MGGINLKLGEIDRRTPLLSSAVISSSLTNPSDEVIAKLPRCSS